MTSIWHKMAAAEPEVSLSPVVRSRARCEIPKVFPEFLRTPDSMEVVPIQQRDCRRYFQEMATAKPEVSLTQVVGVLETKFQKCFGGF
jgi:hypothetical protein